MKKLYSLLFSLLVIGGSALAAPKISEENFNYGYGDAFIFVEGGVEFAVYPDGQFDFFFNSQRNGYNINLVTPHVNISYNAGYNYDPFVQYDDFGAVIQIERVPVFYDYYGRIIQAGNVYISYNNFGRISRIGGLTLHYDRYHRFVDYSGFINTYNPYYVYRPWHNYYIRPYAQYTIVHHQPYRAYYSPVRVTYNYHINYYQTHYNNGYKKSYYRPGQKVASYHRGSRTSQAVDISPRTFNSDYTVATRMDDRNEGRSNTGSRSTTAVVEKKQSSSVRSTANSRGNVNTSTTNSRTATVRDSGNTARQSSSVPQQRQVERTNTTSRSTQVNSPGREVRTNTPAGRSTGRSSGVETATKNSSSQTSGTTSSRSSRGRGN